jgi:hypothetical protein
MVAHVDDALCDCGLCNISRHNEPTRTLCCLLPWLCRVLIELLCLPISLLALTVLTIVILNFLSTIPTGPLLLTWGVDNAAPGSYLPPESHAFFLSLTPLITKLGRHYARSCVWSHSRRRYDWLHGSKYVFHFCSNLPACFLLKTKNKNKKVGRIPRKTSQTMCPVIPLTCKLFLHIYKNGSAGRVLICAHFCGPAELHRPPSSLVSSGSSMFAGRIRNGIVENETTVFTARRRQRSISSDGNIQLTGYRNNKGTRSEFGLLCLRVVFRDKSWYILFPYSLSASVERIVEQYRIEKKVLCRLCHCTVVLSGRLFRGSHFVLNCYVGHARITNP